MYVELVIVFYVKLGFDLEQVEEICCCILVMFYVYLCGLYMYVGDQVLELEFFVKVIKVLVDEFCCLEEVFGIKFDLINVGGGILVFYKYDDENGDLLKDNMYVGIIVQDFVDVVICEVYKWCIDVEICIELGCKVIGLVVVLLMEVFCEKCKINYDFNGNVECYVEWKFVDVGYSVFFDSQYFDWFFYVYNVFCMMVVYDVWIKLVGLLCDGGDYFYMGVKGEEFLLLKEIYVGDIVVFFDVGVYIIES